MFRLRCLQNSFANVNAPHLAGSHNQLLGVGRLWLRPQAAKSSPVKSGAKPKWEEGEAHWALPVHLRSLQLLTVALFDSDSLGEDEVGR